jgi:hypothetical protein
LTFEFHRFRFHFRAGGALYFAPYRTGNMVRGAFGAAFKRLSCTPECSDARTCERRAECAYARIFEPGAAHDGSPSGLADWPRPFVFRASHLDGRTVQAGEDFHFDVHLFEVKESSLPWFVRAFAEAARCGIGPRRAPAELTGVDALSLDGQAVRRVFDGATISEPEQPLAIDLSAGCPGVTRVQVLFATPTELKNDGQAGESFEFDVLLARIRDRISTLRTLYGAGPLEIDFRAMRELAGAVKLNRSSLRRVEIERRSARTGQTHSIGGFAGAAEYEGDLAGFVPYLRAGEVTGVGRQTVWGKGQIVVRTHLAV